MEPKRRIQPGLLEENENLRMPLNEAQETLRAIKSSEVDAIVISGPQGDQVFTLKGADKTYRTIVENMDEGTVIMTRDGDILYCNAYMAKMLEVSLERILTESIMHYVAPSDKSLMDTLISRADSHSIKAELFLVTGKGISIPVHISLVSLEQEGTRCLCMIATDLTQQVRFQKIIEAERLSKSIIKQASDAIIVCDTEGRIIMCSQAAQELCTVNPLMQDFDSLFSIRFADSVQHPSENITLFSIYDCIRGNVFKGIRCSYIGKGGRKLSFILNAGPILSGGTKIVGCTVTLTDITLLEDLLEQVQRVNLFLLSIRDINQIIQHENDAHELLKGTCIYFIETDLCHFAWSILIDDAMNMVDYAEAGLGDDSLLMIHQASSGPLPTCCQKALENTNLVVLGGSPSMCADCMLSHRCQKGVSMASVLKYGDKSYGVLCVCMSEISSSNQEIELFRGLADDIAIALRNLELEKEHTKIDKIKDKFIGMVSHELRTPLTTIVGSLQTALSEGASPEEARELIDNAVQGANSLDALLENMLELSRYQAGMLHFRNESVSIGDVAIGVIRKFEDRGATQRFTVEFPIDLPMVEADPLRVERILYNLLENATKYSPEQSEITIFGLKEKEFVVTGVTDQGDGISAEDQGKIFGQFERLETTSTSVKGIGLGLTVCKQLVEAQGGWIGVDSQFGKGSTFLFALPVYRTS